MAEGASVNAGDLVVRLDAERLDAQVAQARSRLEVGGGAREGSRRARSPTPSASSRGSRSCTPTASRPPTRSTARARCATRRAPSAIPRSPRSPRPTPRSPRRACAPSGSPCARRARRASTRCPTRSASGRRVGAVVAVLLADGAPYARVYVPEEIRARVVPGARATVRIDGVEGEFSGPRAQRLERGRVHALLRAHGARPRPPQLPHQDRSRGRCGARAADRATARGRARARRR